MNAEFLVSVVIVLTLWIFIILVAITPWFGMAIVPFMVIFTFIGAALILGVIWAYSQDSLNDLGWETFVIFALIFASIVIGLVVLVYFIRKKIKALSHWVMKETGIDHKHKEDAVDYREEFIHDHPEKDYHRNYITGTPTKDQAHTYKSPSSEKSVSSPYSLESTYSPPSSSPYKKSVRFTIPDKNPLTMVPLDSPQETAGSFPKQETAGSLSIGSFKSPTRVIHGDSDFNKTLSSLQM